MDLVDNVYLTYIKIGNRWNKTKINDQKPEPQLGYLFNQPVCQPSLTRLDCRSLNLKSFKEI